MELFLEKYLKKLIGRTEIEDALKRLDKLTEDEARMATAQVLKVTHRVDERVRGVGDEVLGVDNRVARVDDRVARVDDSVDQVKRTSSPDCIDTWNVAQSSSQKINYDKIFVDGSPRQIPPRTTTLPVVLITREPQLGSFKAVYIRNGNRRLRFSGFMENVSRCPTPYLTTPEGILCIAGAGKSILWFVNSLPFCQR